MKDEIVTQLAGSACFCIACIHHRTPLEEWAAHIWWDYAAANIGEHAAEYKRRQDR